VSTAPFVPYIDDYGPMKGRGEIEAHVLATLATWIIPYVAAYERLYRLVPRSVPVPPAPESIHGGIDFETWDAAIAPELIALVQPAGGMERYPQEGYGQWFEVQVAAVVHTEGDQDGTRRLADIYGTLLQALLTEQGAFGTALDGVTPFADRTRLMEGAAIAFLDDTVRDVARATVIVHTFVAGLANDLAGPRVPPLDPYAVPLLWPSANKVEIDVVGEEPDGTPSPEENGVLLDGTFVPTRTTYK